MKTLLQFRWFLFNKKTMTFLVFLSLLLFSTSLWGQTKSWSKIGESGFSSSTTNEIDAAIGPNGEVYVVSNIIWYDWCVYKFNGSNWESLGGPIQNLEYKALSIIVSNDGTIYIAAIKPGGEISLPIVRVFKYSGSTWQEIYSSSDPYIWDFLTELVLGNDGYPFLIYKSASDVLSVRKYNGTNWTDYPNCVFNNNVYFLSGAVTSDNTLYIFSDNNGNGLVKKYDGSNWVNVGSSHSGVSVSEVGIAFNSTNVPYIVFRDGNNSNKSTVKKFNGTSWEVVGSAGFSAGSSIYNSIKFDGDVPYVFFKDGGNSDKATVMSFNGTSWENVGSAGFTPGTVDKLRGLIAYQNGEAVPVVAYKDNNAGGYKSAMKYSLKNIEVLSPNGGDTVASNSQYPINWTSNNASNVKIEYTTNNGTSWTTIVSSTPAASGTYNWTTPNVSLENQCRVKVSDIDNPALIYSDGSDAVFTILTPSLNITTPNGGENYNIGTVQNITWTSLAVTNVKLEYTTDGGTNWITIINSTPASAGTYAWTIPPTPSTQCKVKISDASTGTPSDESDAVFTILPPNITVTAPNGGETYQIGTSQNITWISYGVSNVKLEYATDGGTNWITIINSTPASAGTYAWTIPSTPSIQCKVKISDASTGTPSDESDAVFTILPPSITVTAPNGGENFTINTSRKITWTSYGVANVKIEYTTDNGTNWILVVASTPSPTGNGTYSWTVPNTPSTNCKVKISNVIGGTPVDESDETFIITSSELKLVNPNGGESWAATTKNSITWTHINVNNIKIEYSTDNGTNWNVVVASTPAASGSYEWTVPNTPSNSCRVRISDASTPVLFSTSRRTFAITAAPPAPAHIGGWAIQFDGTNDYVEIPDHSSLDLTSTYTLECWIKANSFSGTKGIISKYQSSGANGYFLRLNGNDLEFDGLTADVNLVTGVWYHVAVTKSGTTRKLYLNGEEKTLTGTALNVSANSNYLAIGADFNVGSPNSRIFNGYIDEVRIWNVARTQAEIKMNMYRHLTGGESGLVSYYKMTNGSGTTLTDNKSSNHGTLKNGPNWKSSGCFAAPRNAILFDGTDDYINVPDANSLDLTTNYTLECWINVSSFKWLGGIISKYQTSGSNGYFLRLSGSGSYNDLHFDELTTTGLNLQTNTWYHIAAVKSGSTRKLYVNGREIALSGNPLNVKVNTNEIRIGCDFRQRYFHGKIDEVRIWNVARTQAQIQENMMSPLTGTETGLVLYLRNDYYDGSMSYDLTSNGNNGTLTNLSVPSCWVTSGAFNTWIGGVDNSWSTAGNWSAGTVPSSTDNVGLFNWNDGGNECNINSTPTINNLIISAGSNPSLSSNITVNGNLLLQRDINLNGRTVTLGSSGYLNEGSNRFYGNSGTITTIRTLNNITNENVGGLGFVITTSANMGSTTITRGHAVQTTGDASSIRRYYNVSPTTNTGLNATVKYYYNESELGDIEEADLRLFKSTDNGTSWTNMGGTVFAENNYVTLSGVDGFSMWTLGDANDPLPVELSSFSASVEKQRVILKWQTETETDNYGFEIERSMVSDLGSEFEKIGFVKGNGNSNSPKKYSYSDNIVKSGKFKYRLKQINNNGSFTYSEEIEVIVSIPVEFKLYQNYPNPFNPTTTISFTLHEAGLTTLKIYNAIGEEVIKLIDNEYLETGEYHKREFDARRFASGMYIAKLQSGNKIQIIKMMLLK